MDDALMTLRGNHAPVTNVARMIYTITSGGRALGTTDLGFIYRPDVLRTGWLHPTPLGERLLPMAAGVAPAIRAEYLLGPDPTLHADVLSACDQEHALELELHHEDGTLIETETIGVIDTHYLLSIPVGIDDGEEEYELSPEEDAELQEFLAELKAEEWEAVPDDDEPAEFPRYQVQVRLIDRYAVP
jgi:hypothetical protein